MFVPHSKMLHKRLLNFCKVVWSVNESQIVCVVRVSREQQSAASRCVWLAAARVLRELWEQESEVWGRENTESHAHLQVHPSSSPWTRSPSESKFLRSDVSANLCFSISNSTNCLFTLREMLKNESIYWFAGERKRGNDSPRTTERLPSRHSYQELSALADARHRNKAVIGSKRLSLGDNTGPCI